jgi:hypothetical protein
VQVNHAIEFTVELSDKERACLKYMLDGKCEIERLATLTVKVKVPLQDKLPEDPAENGK